MPMVEISEEEPPQRAAGAADDRILDASEAGRRQEVEGRARGLHADAGGRQIAKRMFSAAGVCGLGRGSFRSGWRSMARDGSSPSGNVRRMWDGPAAVQFHDREDDRNHGTIVD